MRLRKIFIAIVAVLFCSNALHAQRLNISFKIDNNFSKNEKPFDDKPLAWSDFWGKAPESDYMAITSTSTAMRIATETVDKDEYATYTLKFFMNKNASWAKSKNASTALLRHEELHFMLAYNNFLQLIVELKSIKYDVESYKNVVQSIYKDYLRSNSAMQEEYDNDTQHGIVLEQQEKWEKKITEKYNQLKDVANE